MWKHAVKKLPFLIRLVPGPYKTEGMSDKVVAENGVTLKFVFDS